METSQRPLTEEIDDELMRNLDEITVLLSMSGPSQQFRFERHHIVIDMNDLSARWHLFLDNLSWLCDYRPGGKTVASIAAEKTDAGSKFWLATNASGISMVKKHLNCVLQEVQSLATNPSTEVEDVRYRIFRRSITFSHQRIEFYSNTLCALTQQAHSLRETASAGEWHASPLARRFGLTFHPQTQHCFYT